MTVESLFFESWGTTIPLNISKVDQSGGFLQTGQKTFTLYRPRIVFQIVDGQISALNPQHPDQVLWRGSQVPASEAPDAERHAIPRFHQALFVQGDDVLVLASGQDVYRLQGGDREDKVQLRGIARNEAGEFQIALRKEEHVEILGREGLKIETGPETAGPWTLYRHSSEGDWFVNHASRRQYGPEGRLVNEEPLTDERYENSVFPFSFRIEAIAAESLDQILISHTGPEGYGILRLHLGQ